MLINVLVKGEFHRDVPLPLPAEARPCEEGSPKVCAHSAARPAYLVSTEPRMPGSRGLCLRPTSAQRPPRSRDWNREVTAVETKRALVRQETR